jgi:glycosyltransferase involved in cell wall biosynthesis
VQEVFDYAEELDILSRFKWIDRIENVKMSGLYSIVAKRGGLCLVTSHCESFGMSVLESLLAGCPIVCTNVGALPEITEPSNFFKLYELLDFEAAAAYSLEVLANSKQINESLLKSREKLVHEYDSASRSVEYWTILEKKV